MTSNKKHFQKVYENKETNTYLYKINLSSFVHDKNFDIKLIFKNKKLTIYKHFNPSNIKHDFFIFNYVINDNNFKQLSSTNMLQIYYEIFENQEIRKLKNLLNNALRFLNEHVFSLSFFLEIFKCYHSHKKQGKTILSNFMFVNIQFQI